MENPSRFEFYERLSLPSLKKITVIIPEKSQSETNRQALPKQFMRLLDLLKEIHFGKLEFIRFICEPLTAIRLPLGKVSITDVMPLD